MSKPSANPEPPKRKARAIPWSSIAPAIAFVLIIAVALLSYLRQQAIAQREHVQQERHIASLGLPDDFPIADIPLYPGLKVTEKKRDDAKSSDGRPMDAWEVHGTTPDDKQKVFDFYKQKLLAEGMGQTQYISIPTGLDAIYADQRYSVEFQIERLHKDKPTTVVIKAYRIK